MASRRFSHCTANSSLAPCDNPSTLTSSKPSAARYHTNSCVRDIWPRFRPTIYFTVMGNSTEKFRPHSRTIRIEKRKGPFKQPYSSRTSSIGSCGDKLDEEQRSEKRAKPDFNSVGHSEKNINMPVWYSIQPASTENIAQVPARETTRMPSTISYPDNLLDLLECWTNLSPAQISDLICADSQMVIPEPVWC